MIKVSKITLLLSIILFSAACSQEMKKTSAIENITAAQVKQMIKAGQKPFLLDVRTPGEYDGPMGHIKGSVLIPLQELSKRYTELEAHKNKKIIVYCHSGNRSQVAAQILQAKGFNVINMLGGMQAWNEL